MPALSAYLEANVHEPPARPRTIVQIEALPVTAVGKIFKPALRERAIEEKVRQEAARLIGPDVALTIEVGLDARKQTVVHIRVLGADDAARSRLAEVLVSLPQTYLIESVDG
jgi:fatty-acyl-CoA synthase